jgi:phosphomannomutase
MRQKNAIYGGKMSAHHYFRNFAYCDSGMIPWLLVAELISVEGKPLSQLVSERQQAYPCSGERNFKVANMQASIERVKEHFSGQNPVMDDTDGMSMEFEDWRMNLRGSNTEPLLRLNIEARSSEARIQDQLERITALLGAGKC